MKKCQKYLELVQYNQKSKFKFYKIKINYLGRRWCQITSKSYLASLIGIRKNLEKNRSYKGKSALDIQPEVN